VVSSVRFVFCFMCCEHVISPGQGVSSLHAQECLERLTASCALHVPGFASGTSIGSSGSPADTQTPAPSSVASLRTPIESAARLPAAAAAPPAGAKRRQRRRRRCRFGPGWLNGINHAAATGHGLLMAWRRCCLREHARRLQQNHSPACRSRAVPNIRGRHAA